MKNFQKKRGTWRDIFQSKPVLVLLGLIVLVFAWSVFGFWNKMKETSKNKKVVEDRVAELKEQKQKLISDINNLQTKEGKEGFIRENYGLAKEGEDVIIVVDDKNSPAVPQADSALGFWSFLKNLFK